MRQRPPLGRVLLEKHRFPQLFKEFIVLQNLDFLYVVYKEPPPVHFLCQMDPIHTLASSTFEFNFFYPIYASPGLMHAEGALLLSEVLQTLKWRARWFCAVFETRHTSPYQAIDALGCQIPQVFDTKSVHTSFGGHVYVLFNLKLSRRVNSVNHLYLAVP